MNKVLIITVMPDQRGTVKTGGIEIDTLQGVREALAMAEFARTQLTEALVRIRAEELAKQPEEEPKPKDP